MEFWKKIGFQISLCFIKKSIILQSCLIKSLISTIKTHNKFQNFLTSMDTYNKAPQNCLEFFNKFGQVK